MICEKCGFETGPSAKFCAVCGAPVVAVQQPEPAPEVESVSASSYFSVAPSEVVTAEDNVAAEPETLEVGAPIDTFFEESEPEAAEVQVYNSEMTAPEAFVQDEAPVAPAPEIPPVISFEPAPQNVTAPPASSAGPMYGVPADQAYYAAPMYAMPNTPVYNGAPNGQVYGGAPNGQVYGGAPNGQVYGGAPAYAPVYNNAPGYGAPMQTYPGGPVYAAPVAPVYAPQGATVYTPEYYGEEPAPERKSVSIVALVGSMVTILAFFLKLSHELSCSMFNIISEWLPDLLDVIEYIDMFGTAAYLEMTIIGISVLCAIFSVVVFILACLKKNCRVIAILSMVLMIGLVAVSWWLIVEISDRPANIDFEFILNMIESLSVGFWLYFGGMLVAAIGGGKR